MTCSDLNISIGEDVPEYISQSNPLNSAIAYVKRYLIDKSLSPFLRINISQKICPLWVIMMANCDEQVNDILRTVLLFVPTDNPIYNKIVLAAYYLSPFSVDQRFINFRERMWAIGQRDIFKVACGLKQRDSFNTSNDLACKRLLFNVLFNNNTLGANLSLFSRGPAIDLNDPACYLKRLENGYSNVTYPVSILSLVIESFPPLTPIESNVYRRMFGEYLVTNRRTLVDKLENQQDYAQVFEDLRNSKLAGYAEVYYPDLLIGHYNQLMNIYQHFFDYYLQGAQMWRFTNGRHATNKLRSLTHERLRSEIGYRRERKQGANPLIGFGSFKKQQTFSIEELIHYFSPDGDGMVTFIIPNDIDAEGRRVQHGLFPYHMISSLSNFISALIQENYLSSILITLEDYIQTGMFQHSQQEDDWDLVHDNVSVQMHEFVVWFFFLGLYCHYWRQGMSWYEQWKEREDDVETENERQRRVTDHLALLPGILTRLQEPDNWQIGNGYPTFNEGSPLMSFPIIGNNQRRTIYNFQNLFTLLLQGNFCLSELADIGVNTAWKYYFKIVNSERTPQQFADFIERHAGVSWPGGVPELPAEFDILRYSASNHILVFDMEFE